jgi:hypothetical protein
MAESIEQLSFELVIREMAAQERALAGPLRTCAGIVLAAASIAGSLPTAGTGHGVLLGIEMVLWAVNVTR